MGSKRAAGKNKWELRVYVGKFDGRTVYKSRTVRGTAREADRELARLTLEVDAGDHDPPDATRRTLTVAEWVRRCIDRQSPEWSPTSTERAEVVYEHHLGRLADLPINEVRLRDVEAWMTAQLRAGLAPGSVRRNFGVIRAAFEQAERWEIIDRNPCRHATQPKVPYKESRVPTAEDLAATLAACKTITERTFVWLAAATGGRRGQLVGLRWSDFDVEAGILTFHRAVVAVPGGWDVKAPKGGRPITLAVDQDTLDVVGTYYAWRQAQLRGLGLHRLSLDSYIFSRDLKGDEPWHPSSASHIWTRIRVRVPALDGVRLHDLRHAHATWMIAAGVDPKTASSRLGHSAMGTLDRYTHRVSEADRAASQIIGRLLVGKTAEVTELPVNE